MTTAERRAPVQGDHRVPRGAPGRAPGSISWEEHLRAWQDYSRRYGKDQSPERIAERGGFGYLELVNHLGKAPGSWQPEPPEAA